jgi:hypothetical protein
MLVGFFWNRFPPHLESIPPTIPLPVHMKKVVMPEMLSSENSGSRKAETTHIITKYATPASKPQRNLRHIALFAYINPANIDDIQYISIIHTVTNPSLISAIYSKKATARSKIALITYAAIRHFNKANALFKTLTP